MINQIVCNSLAEIEQNINAVSEPLNQFVFRGLSDLQYELITSIEQKIKDKKKANFYVKSMIQLFRDELISKDNKQKIYTDNFNFPKPNYKNDWLILAQAQHLRIPTILMDWSINWKTALFFAAFDIKNIHKSGALWILNASSYLNNDDLLREDSIYYSDPLNYTGASRIINIATDCNSLDFLALQRIKYQGGRFLITSLNQKFNEVEFMEDFNNRLTKIIITSACKLEIINLNSSSHEVPYCISNLPGVKRINNKFYRKFDESFFYGSINDSLETITSKIIADVLV